IAEGRGRGLAALDELLSEAVDAAPRAVRIARDIVLVGDTCRHDIGNDDGHPGSCEHPGGGVTDPDRLAAAGDQRNTSGTRHVCLLAMRPGSARSKNGSRRRERRGWNRPSPSRFAGPSLSPLKQGEGIYTAHSLAPLAGRGSG